MPLDTPTCRQSFIDAFYDEKRGLKRVPASAIWEDWLKCHGLPIVLPVTFNQLQTKTTSVILIAANSNDFRRLNNEFRAFLGPSFSSGVMQSIGKQSFIYQHCGESCFAVRYLVPSEKYTSANSALSRWCNVWYLRQSVALPQRSEQSLDELLSESLSGFHRALAAKDRASALSAMQSIEDRALLETTNRIFLRIQFYAAFNEWSAILTDKHLTDTMRLTRPAAVTEALLQAVYWNWLSGLVSDLPQLFSVFRSQISTAFRPLFSTRGTLISREVLILFALYAICPENEADQDLDAYHDVLQISGIPTEEHEYLVKLGEFANVDVTPKKAQDIVPLSVETLLQQGQVDRALAQLSTEPPGFDKAVKALRYTYRDGSYWSRSLAWNSISELDPVTRQMFFSNIPQGKLDNWLGLMPRVPMELSLGLTDSLKTQLHQTHLIRPILESTVDDRTTSNLPNCWMDWVKQALQTALPSELLLEGAVAGVAEWNVANLDGRAEEFAETLDLLRDNATTRQLLVRSFPYVTRAFLDDPMYARASFGPIYSSLRWTLAYDLEDRSRTGLLIFYDLVAGQLMGAVSIKEYQTILDEMRLYWDGGGAADARLLLDQMDVLQCFTSLDPVRRMQLARMVFSKVSGWIQSNRLQPDVEDYARRLALEYGLDSLLPARQPIPLNEDMLTVETNWSKLSGKRVAIYTLMEPTGRRVQNLLSDLCPECRVDVNSERDGNKILENLAKTVDVFIVISGCAKHAATESIERYRPADKCILRPTGRGSSSVLNALSDYLRMT